MSETRYVEVYDGEGNVVAYEPYQVSDEQLAEEANQIRVQELLVILETCHSSHVIPLPDLTSFVILICEYIVRSQPR